MWARWAFLAERMFDCRTFVRPEVPKTTVEPAWAVLRMFQGMALHRTLRTWTFHRAGQLDPNPTTFAQRSATFASASTTRYNSVSLIATRTEDGVRGYLVTGDWRGMDKAALALAHTVGAKAEEVDSPPDLTGPGREVVGRLEYRTGNSGGLIQAGADPSEVVKTLAQAMPMNSWVGVVMRRPTGMEHDRWFEWLNTRHGGGQSHNTRQTNYPVVTSIYAATSSHFGTRSLLNQVASSLPGFDMSVGTQIPMRWTAAAVPFLLPLLLLIAHLLPGLVNSVISDPELLAQLPVQLTAEPIVEMSNVWRGVGLASVLSVLVGLGIIPSRWSRLRSALRRGTLPRPYVRLIPARRGQTHNFQHQNKIGQYPLDNRSFMVAPHLLTTLVAPHAGAVTGASSTRTRAVPSVMTGRIGPLVGHADEGTPVHLSARDLQHGCAVIGRPGAGKSVLMQNLFAWSALDRVRPAGGPGFPGKRNSLIVFEPKLDGAQDYARWARSVGDQLLVSEIAHPQGLAVDFFDRPGTVLDRAEFFTESLRYAFDDGAIQGASAEALRAVLAGGLVVTDDMVTNLHEGAGGADPILIIEKARSPLYYAHVLLGSLGDDVAVALAGQISNAANALVSEGNASADVVLANSKLAPIFVGRTPSQRASYSQAPRNKLDALASIDHFFAPHRPKVSWSQVLEQHLALVILTGVDSGNHMMTGYTEKLMSSLLMYSLRDAIERHCTGWEHQDRWVSVFVDELSMIAGNDPEIITWLKNRGRSYGVRPIFATQFPGQLMPEVRDTFLSFSNLITYTLDSPAIAKEVVADLSGDGTEWTVGDVLELPQFSAIIRANVDRQRQPPFAFRAAYWSADEPSRQRFIHDQGYAATGQFQAYPAPGFSPLPEEAA